MIIYISMFVVIFLVFLIRKLNDNYNDSKLISNLDVIVIFGYIIFWVGIRDSFVDTSAYILRFNDASISNLSNLDFTFGSGWGFDVLEILFKTFISSNYHAWLMFLAIISGGCIAYTFKRYSINFYYSVFLFLSTTTFTWMMNGIRQFLVASIIFACTPLIEKRKSLLYILIVLLFSTIHSSCIIMIPIYFVSQLKPWKAKSISIILIFLLITIFSTKFTGFLDEILSFSSYSDISEKFAIDDGVNPLRVLVYSVTTIIAFLGRKRLDKQSDIFVNMSVMTSGLYLIGMTTSGLLIGRLPIYVQMYQFILLPQLYEKIFTRESSKLLYVCSILCFLMYFYLMTKGIYYSSEITGRLL